MTLRTRVTLAVGVAVLLAAVAVSIAVYVVMRGTLQGQIDRSLNHDGPVADSAQRHGPSPDTPTAPEHLPQVHDVFMQMVDRDGKVITVFDNRPLPVTADVVAVARGERGEIYFDADIDGTPVRVYVTSAGPGTALQVGRSLIEVQQALRQLVLTLIAISVAAVGLAAVIGRLIAAAAVAQVHRVAQAAETVARTGELSHHITVPSGDDLGRLTQQLARGVIAFSSGNHALAVAAAAATAGSSALLVMPAEAPHAKLAAVRGLGAQVVTFDRYTEDRFALTDRLAAEHGLTPIPRMTTPTSSPARAPPPQNCWSRPVRWTCWSSRWAEEANWRERAWCVPPPATAPA